MPTELYEPINDLDYDNEFEQLMIPSYDTECEYTTYIDVDKREALNFD